MLPDNIASGLDNLLGQCHCVIIVKLPSGVSNSVLLQELTSSSAITERLRCRVGQFWPKVEDDILQTIYIYLHPL